jgi:hypothetical protein
MMVDSECKDQAHVLPGSCNYVGYNSLHRSRVTFVRALGVQNKLRRVSTAGSINYLINQRKRSPDEGGLATQSSSPLGIRIEGKSCSG